MREPAEWDINHIDGAQLIPSSLISSGEGLAKLPAGPQAGAVLQDGRALGRGAGGGRRAPGFADAVHLQGGIVAWAQQMQPDMVMY